MGVIRVHRQNCADIRLERTTGLERPSKGQTSLGLKVVDELRGLGLQRLRAQDLGC